ncbi:MAG TPA: aminotransferase class V-fold PLP-dependent enzyme [Methanocorpusculum sp.]|nr:aminotransferase class V-fold PLP-dependent enzyme [Methanocorpusculum sp.]
MIYLDNAATTLKKPQEVIDAVVSALQSLGNSSRGTHAAGISASDMIYTARKKIAAFFGCKRPDHVIFTSNVTESLNIVINGLFSKGDHIITTDLEHNSVLRPLYRLQEETGVSVDFVPADVNGVLDYDAFSRLLRPETKAVICSHASNLTGNVTDIQYVGSFAKKHNLTFILDAAQTAGTRRIDMQESGIDVLCFTGHKGLLGPQGTGGICIREGIEIRPFKVGGTGVQSYRKSQPEEYPTRLEAGTLNGHGIAGLSAAIDYLNRVGVDAVEEKEKALTYRFYNALKNEANVRIYGDFTREHAGIVTLNISGYDSGDVAFVLSEKYGIATRPGAHCAPRMHTAMHTEESGAVRFSFSWFTTDDEIDAAIKAVKEIAASDSLRI